MSSGFEKQILRLLRRYAVAIVGLSFAGNLLMLALPLYTLQVYDRVLQSGSGATLLVLTLIVVPLTVGYGVLDYAVRRAGAGTAAALERLAAVPVLHRDIGAGERLGRQSVDTLIGLLNGNRFGHLLDLLWAPLFIVILALIDPMLAVISLVGCAVLVAVVWWSEWRQHAEAPVIRPQQERYARFWLRSVAHRESIIGNGATGPMAAHGRMLMHRAVDGRLAESGIGHLTFAGARTVRMMLQVALVGTGGVLAIRGELSGGGIVAATIMMARALAPIEQCLSSWRSLGDAWRAIGWLTDPARAGDRARPAAPALPAGDALLRLDGLAYGPPNAEAPLCSDISFELGRGAIMVVIGMVGTGKTSLLRVLCGIEEPKAGAVLRAGTHPADGGLGYAPQQPHLFEGTVAENVAMFRPHTPEQVWQAIRDAGVERIVGQMPGGVDHPIGELTMLSGGQQQAICLSRAFFGRPPLMIFDEPTARLDSHAELAFAKALHESRQRGASCIVVTHSDRILRLADKLLLLRPGEPHELFETSEQLVRKLAPRGQPDAALAQAAIPAE